MCVITSQHVAQRWRHWRESYNPPTSPTTTLTDWVVFTSSACQIPTALHSPSPILTSRIQPTANMTMWRYWNVGVVATTAVVIFNETIQLYFGWFTFFKEQTDLCLRMFVFQNVVVVWWWCRWCSGCSDNGCVSMMFYAVRQDGDNWYQMDVCYKQDKNYYLKCEKKKKKKIIHKLPYQQKACLWTWNG